MPAHELSIAAIDAAVVGAIAAVVGIPVGVATAFLGPVKRFRPHAKARIDERRQGIRLDLRNKGRASGRINQVAVVGNGDVELPEARFAGLPGDRFKPAELPARAKRYLIITATPATGAFPPSTRVRVEWGTGKNRTLEPKESKDVAYYGMESDWG